MCSFDGNEREVVVSPSHVLEDSLREVLREYRNVAYSWAEGSRCLSWWAHGLIFAMKEASVATVDDSILTCSHWLWWVAGLSPRVIAPFTGASIAASLSPSLSRLAVSISTSWVEEGKENASRLHYPEHGSPILLAYWAKSRSPWHFAG